jgi:hypothetical protein
MIVSDQHPAALPSINILYHTDLLAFFICPTISIMGGPVHR